ncbi:DNA-(apurinic or apyrimidinic site) endonuclease 2 isoform X2 [Zootoca vivipara]|uniref:DNA-(apurinic or apyrimidinic site) endonuclease 2 isoform X2 n=1 Tax=Zootoca vivipara TaxID=8524 RepID=UPI00293BCB9E|nr:DNA-(apurinic or apyrimidinic site) endonuclease 2 isoform X2 [Zootoca vivipara]
MRLASWNVNGLRAGLGPAGLKPLLDSLEADVICLQETKVTRDLLEEPLAIVEGYNSYFSFSRTRNGYSGVATFCKVSATPEAAEEGLSGLFAKHDGAVGYYGETEGFTTEELQALDSEGRAVITRHRIRHVVILGDINTAHKPIDHCDPGDLESFQEHLGRRWLDSFLWEPDKDSQDGKCFVDTFRFLHPGQSDAYTCWCNVTGSRQLNYGTRIDYILADRALALSELQDAQLMPDVFGSDHCPVWVVLRSVCLGAPRCPPLCTRFLPEFAGTQQKLNHFLVKVERTSLPEERGQKRGGREPSVAGGSKKRRVGPPQKGQGDLRSFFKAGNGRPRATTNSANCQSVMKMRTAEDSGVEPPLDASGRTTDEHGVEEFAGGSQACAGSLREEPTLGMANGGALDCGKGTVPSSSTQSAALWKSLLPGPARPPHCKAHGEPCVLRTVKKPGPNSGRRFYVCARPLGKPSDPRSRCDFFLWASRGNP